MDDIRSIRLRRLHTELGEIVYELTRIQLSPFGQPDVWSPAINAYRCDDCISICMDLAGVDKDSIDVQVEPKRLLVSGKRLPPEPSGTERRTVQILAMEIDHGPFRRELTLPIEVDADRVSAEQSNGLLWIYLPLRPHG